MRAIFTIAEREFRSLITAPLGYVVMTFFLFVTGFFFYAPLASNVDIAIQEVRAELAAKSGDLTQAILSATKAVELQDAQAYNEPETWHRPTRLVLGALLIEAGTFAEAEKAYAEDLRRHPETGWALVGLREVEAEKRAHPDRTPTVIHNLITSRAVPDFLDAAGARTVRTRVGHSFIKAQMAEHDAVFGGEHSAHYYFRDFFFADTGMLAALHVLAALGGQPHPLSALADQYQPYVASGEINSRVADVAAARARVVGHAALVQDLGEAMVDADREMAESLKSDDFKEGVASFVEKRAVRFTGV